MKRLVIVVCVIGLVGCTVFFANNVWKGRNSTEIEYLAEKETEIISEEVVDNFFSEGAESESFVDETDVVYEDLEELSPIEDMRITEYSFFTIRNRVGYEEYKRFLIDLDNCLKAGYYAYGYSTRYIEEEDCYYIVIGGKYVYKATVVDGRVCLEDTDCTETDIQYKIIESDNETTLENDIVGLTVFMGYSSYDYVEDYLESNFAKYQYIDSTIEIEGIMEVFINTNMGMLKGTYTVETDEIVLEKVNLSEKEVKKYIWNKELGNVL